MKHKSNIYNIWIIIILYCILTGCVSQGASPTMAQETPRTSTSLLTITPEKTITPAHIVGTTPTTAILFNHIEKQCIKEGKSTPMLSEGTVVLSTKEHELELLNLATFQSVSLGKAYPIVAVSPNHDELAFIAEESGILSIVNSSGNHLSDIRLPYQQAGVVSWLSKDKLIVQPFEQSIDTPYSKAGTPFLFNLKTNERQEVSISFPNIETPPFPPREWGNYRYSEVVYDPSYSRAIYISQDENSLPLLTLYDISNKKILNSFYQRPDPDYGGVPQWSHDGSFFVASIYPDYSKSPSLMGSDASNSLPYKGGGDLFKVYADGSLERLTYLTTQYKAGEEQFSLSPDGQTIAFWLNLDYEPRDENAARELAVLNMKSGQIMNLCINGGSAPVAPSWSPDGKYLLLTIYNKDQVKPDVYLVDLEKGVSMSIADGKIAQAWLVDFP